MNTLAKAVDALCDAQHIMVFTGAGVSAGSGIPTFRDRLTGLCERQDPQRLESAKAFREIRRWFGAGTYGGASRSCKLSPMRPMQRFIGYLTAVGV